MTCGVLRSTDVSVVERAVKFMHLTGAAYRSVFPFSASSFVLTGLEDIALLVISSKIITFLKVSVSLPVFRYSLSNRVQMSNTALLKLIVNLVLPNQLL